VRRSGAVESGVALSDTDPEAEAVHLALLRAASPSRRLRLAFSMSRTVMSLSRDALARGDPSASPEDIGLRFVELNYGPELAAALRADLLARRS
jgi:hypothetical protein